MHVSVVVPVKDDPRVFGCVASIRLAGGERPLEIIVVDNGSEAAFASDLRGLEAGGVRVLEARGTVYAARNAGISAATGEAILFTDADCTVASDWVAAARASLAGGADLAQGLSGSAADGWRDRLIQARYESPFRKLRAGAPVECDTRNLAVRRAVVERVRFEERFRRVGDTGFGLRAEALGFRVAFTPGMRVWHEHDYSIDMLVAKQACHGWGAQRLMRDSPGLPWHGSHLRFAAKWSPQIERLPIHGAPARLLAAAAIRGARLLDRAGPRLPFGVSVALLGMLDKTAGLAGHLMYEPGDPEPSPSGLLGRSLARD